MNFIAIFISITAYLLVSGFCTYFAVDALDPDWNAYHATGKNIWHRTFIIATAVLWPLVLPALAGAATARRLQHFSRGPSRKEEQALLEGRIELPTPRHHPYKNCKNVVEVLEAVEAHERLQDNL